MEENSAPDIDPQSVISAEQTEGTDKIRKMTTEEWILASPLSSPSSAAVMEDARSPEIFKSEYVFQSPLQYDTKDFGDLIDFELKPTVPLPKESDGVASVDANTELSGDACFSDEGETVQSEDENAEVPCCSTSKDLIGENNYFELDFEDCRIQTVKIIELSSDSQSSNSEVHQNQQDHDYELVKTSVDGHVLLDSQSQDISDVPSLCVSQNRPSVALEFKSTSGKNMVNSEIESDNRPKAISSESIQSIYAEDDLTLNQHNGANDVHTDFFKAYQTQESETSSFSQSILNEIRQRSVGCSFEHTRDTPDSETTSTASSGSSDTVLAEISGSENSVAFEFERTNEQNMDNSELQSDNKEGTTSEMNVEIFDTIEKSTSVSQTATGQNAKNSGIQDSGREENTGVGSNSSETERTLQNINEDFENIKVSEIYKPEITNKQNVINSEMQENNNEGNTCIVNISITEVERDSEIITATFKTIKDSVNYGYVTDMKSETQKTTEENNSVENILSPRKKTVYENVTRNLGAIKSQAIEKSGTTDEQNIIIANENIEESKTQEGSEENMCIENTPSTDMETESGKFIENSGTRNEILHVDPIKPKQEDQIISKNNISAPCCINCNKPNFDSKSATIREYTVQPVVILKPLLDLFEIDNSLSRMILLALSREFKENGVTKTELLEYLREKEFPASIAQLKLDIQKFFTAAAGVNITFKKNRRQFLNVEPVIKEQSDVQEYKPVTSRKRKNENDLENVQDLPKRVAKSQKGETSTRSNTTAENKSKITKKGKINKDEQIIDPKLTKKHKQPPLQTKNGKSKSETQTVKNPRKQKLADVVQEILVKKRKRVI